jgi:hypothetical protein
MRHGYFTFALTIAALSLLPTNSSAQTVQLPQFQFTTATTTVLVPDRGEVLLGGINRATEGRSQFGVPILGKVPVLGRPFNNVGIGSSRSSGTLSVRAYIHDFEAMDEALLAQAAARRGGASVAASSLQPPASSLQPVLGIAEIERQRAAAEDAERFDIGNLVAKARQAEADGKPGVARIFYGMVAKNTKDPAQRAMAQTRVAELGRPARPKLASNPR